MSIILNVCLGLSIILNIVLAFKFKNVNKSSNGKETELRLMLNSFEGEIKRFKTKHGLNK